jgi:hypothetical protein
MLEALKALNGREIRMPTRAKDWPDRDRLAVRSALPGCGLTAPTTVQVMTDHLIDVSELETALQTFADERDWQQFPDPLSKKLAR